MPRLDGTGPRGQGPRTGRGCGQCCYGLGCGCNQGCSNCPFGCGLLSRKEEADMLAEAESALEERLEAVRERKAELLGQK